MKIEGTPIEKILARTVSDLPARKKQKPLALLQTLAKAAPKPPPFEQTLRRTRGARLIAELKRKTPKGFIDRDLDHIQAARDFAHGGAAALSVVTEGPFFGGSLEDLTRARQGAKVPLLRRDFVVDEFQLAESRANGASAVTLIAAAQETKQLGALLRFARELELEVVVEVYDSADLDRALDAGAAMVLIHLRDAQGQPMDPTATQALAATAGRSGALTMAADGLATVEEIQRLRSIGIEAFVVGEYFLRAGDRMHAVRSFRDALGT